jgi:hypothetical protein
MITASLGLNWSNFQSGIQGAISSIQQLASGASIFQGLKFAANGFYEAVQMGDDLVDLNAQTGVAIDKLMELQMAFDLNGMKADQVQPVLSKMQKMIAEAGAGSAETAAKFSMMGISIQEIQGLNADEQLMEIGKAIGEIKNPAQRSAMAMEIFGKSGAKLLSVFAAGGMDEVRKMLGGQAEILLKNAGVFGKASDLLGVAGQKLRGFFVGVASEVLPQIMPIIDKAASLDLSGVGKDFGNSLAIALEIISQIANKIDEMIPKTGKIAVALQTGFDVAKSNISTLVGLFGALEKFGAFNQIKKDVQAKQEAAQNENPTPGPAPTGMDILRKAGVGLTGGLPDISSLQKVGGGSALLSGGQDNSPAYQSVRIQEDIRDYIKDLIQAVKEGSQDYQITPNTGGDMVLTA